MSRRTGLEGYLSNILETVAEGIALIGPDGRYSFVNAAAESLFAVPRTAIIGRRYDDPVWEFTRPDGTPVTVDEMPPSIVMRTERPLLDTVFGATLPDGRKVSLAINAVPFRDMQGAMVGTLLSFSDITRRQNVERLDRALNDVGAAVNSSFDLDTVLQRALDTAVDALGCDSGVLFLNEGPDWVMRYLCNLPHDMIGTRIPEERASFTTLSGGRAGAIAFNDAFNDERIDNRVMRRFTIRALLDVTLKVRERTIADVSFIYHSRTGRFGQDEVNFANKFGSLVGLALENGELYRAEQEVSRYLQRALLGEPASVDGIAFSHVYRSGTKTTFVGGDFYDLFEIDEDRVAVLLGDVSGHGLSKATIAAMSKHTMIAYLREGESPAGVAQRADNVIAHSTDDDTFITAVIGVLHKDSGRFEYSNCGHPQPLVIRANGAVEPLQERFPLLGAIPGVTFGQAEATLGSGDVLVLYTDGVTEARGADGLLGDRRAIELLEKSAGTPAEDISQVLLSAVSEFAVGDLKDDVAIVALSLGAAAHR